MTPRAEIGIPRVESTLSDCRRELRPPAAAPGAACPDWIPTDPRIFLGSVWISNHIPPSKPVLLLQFSNISAATTSVNRVFSEQINSEKLIMYTEIGFLYNGYGTGILLAPVPAVK